jgi:hypothetical protein
VVRRAAAAAAGGGGAGVGGLGGAVGGGVAWQRTTGDGAHAHAGEAQGRWRGGEAARGALSMS